MLLLLLWYGWWSGFDRFAGAVRPLKVIPHIVIALVIINNRQKENGKGGEKLLTTGDVVKR